MKLGYFLSSIVLAQTLAAKDFVKWDHTSIYARALKGTDVYKEKFSFENLTTYRVSIGEISPDCDCLAATAENRFIGPGEKGIIEVLVDLKDKHLQARHNLTVKIGHYDDIGSITTYELSITVDLIDPLVVKPKVLVFNSDNDNQSLTVEILPANGSIDMVTFHNPPGIEATVSGDSPKDRYIATIRPKRSAAEGTNIIRLTAQFSNGTQFSSNIYIIVQGGAKK